mmetsp:Transcript_61036/g.120890  ORF Transcript_61036/g.120890 Transcript_61036/m.120890 type:complete len:200 (+) Transcript_61036:249-848(+)
MLVPLRLAASSAFRDSWVPPTSVSAVDTSVDKIVPDASQLAPSKQPAPLQSATMAVGFVGATPSNGCTVDSTGCTYWDGASGNCGEKSDVSPMSAARELLLLLVAAMLEGIGGRLSSCCCCCRCCFWPPFSFLAANAARVAFRSSVSVANVGGVGGVGLLIPATGIDCDTSALSSLSCSLLPTSLATAGVVTGATALKV